MASTADPYYDSTLPSPAASTPSTSAGGATRAGAGGNGANAGASATTQRNRATKEKETHACAFPGCGQSYSRMEYLKRHQRKHQDVRPFNCKDCGKAFARSDVLLRHRRRCHPTPPPESLSPPGRPRAINAYTGVPVSSSRNDSRELSPLRGGGGGGGSSRKHGREYDDYDPELDPLLHGHPSGSGAGMGDVHPPERQRARLGEEDGLSDDDEDGFGAMGRSLFSNAHPLDTDGYYGSGGGNGHGHGGVTAGDEGESASYTPHLLPVFQTHQQQSHLGHHANPARPTTANGAGAHASDPNHLEDASVLLSMAYPTGVPGKDGAAAGAGAQGEGDASRGDWSAEQINLLMGGGQASGAGGHAAAGTGADALGGPTQEPISKAVLNDAMGNLFSSMTWMQDGAGQGQVTGPSEDDVRGVSDWMSSDVPLLDPALSGARAMETLGDGSRLDSGASNGANYNGDAPMSPFPLASLFSPSLFGLPSLSAVGSGSEAQSLPSESSGGAQTHIELGTDMGGICQFLGQQGFGAGLGMGLLQQDPMSHGNSSSGTQPRQNRIDPKVQLMLDQMARRDTPQTRGNLNPNPERPLMRIASDLLVRKQGPQTLSLDARFYLDPERFSGCYQIPHWKMPPIRTLSLMASRTFDTVMNHFSFVHGPTFKLTDAAACLAFAICTIGGIRNTRQKGDALLDYVDMSGGGMDATGLGLGLGRKGMDGPVLPEDTWEGMYRANYTRGKGARKPDAARGGLGVNGGVGAGVGVGVGLDELLAQQGARMMRDHAHQGKNGSTERDADAGLDLDLDALAGDGNGDRDEMKPLSKDEMREQEDKRLVEAWDAGSTVRNEKTNMLVKSFSLAKGVLMTEYNVALLQALILYHAPYFLSEDEGERACANMFLGTIVNITRQIGFLTSELEHFENAIALPLDTSSSADLHTYWRRWIQLETRRRVAWLVYHLDTISSLESNIPCILTSAEYSHMPLPAPDALWKAPSAEAWLRAVRRYRPMSLDEAMRRVFYLPSFGAFDEVHAQALCQGQGQGQGQGHGQGQNDYDLLNEYEYGPFARTSMCLTLLRGVMDVGEGKRDRGDWRDLTDLWVSCSWLRPGKRLVDANGREVGEVGRATLRDRFALGLERWRQGWDFDSLCSGRGTNAGAGAGSGSGSTGTSPAGLRTPASLSAQRERGSPASPGVDAGGCPKLTYCEEALPYYWLAQALLGILGNAPACAIGTNQLKGIRYGEMLKSARTFTRLGEGLGSAGSASASTAGSSYNIPPTPASMTAGTTATMSNNYAGMGTAGSASAPSTSYATPAGTAASTTASHSGAGMPLDLRSGGAAAFGSAGVVPAPGVSMAQAQMAAQANASASASFATGTGTGSGMGVFGYDFFGPWFPSSVSTGFSPVPVSGPGSVGPSPGTAGTATTTTTATATADGGGAAAPAAADGIGMEYTWGGDGMGMGFELPGEMVGDFGGAGGVGGMDLGVDVGMGMGMPLGSDVQAGASAGAGAGAEDGGGAKKAGHQEGLMGYGMGGW